MPIYNKVSGEWKQIKNGRPWIKDTTGIWKTVDPFVKVNGSWRYIGNQALYGLKVYIKDFPYYGYTAPAVGSTANLAGTYSVLDRISNQNLQYDLLGSSDVTGILKMNRDHYNLNSKQFTVLMWVSFLASPKPGVDQIPYHSFRIFSIDDILDVNNQRSNISYKSSNIPCQNGIITGRYYNGNYNYNYPGVSLPCSTLYYIQNTPGSYPEFGGVNYDVSLYDNRQYVLYGIQVNFDAEIPYFNYTIASRTSMVWARQIYVDSNGNEIPSFQQNITTNIKSVQVSGATLYNNIFKQEFFKQTFSDQLFFGMGFKNYMVYNRAISNTELQYIYQQGPDFEYIKL